MKANKGQHLSARAYN